MTFKNFLLEIDNDGIAVFTVNRPQAYNALNAESWEEIGDFIKEVNRSDDIKAAIITGAGEKAFVAGADINMLKERTMVMAMNGIAQGVLNALEQCNKPVIAAINGCAYGGGCELALACDIRVASKNAEFCLPELGLGILPGAGGTQRLSKIIGFGRAKEIILTGRKVDADEAMRIGLISKTVTSALLIDEAKAIAGSIISKAPLAVQLAKRAISASMSSDQETGMLLELFAYSLLIGSKDKTEGVNAFFEKRSPIFWGE